MNLKEPNPFIGALSQVYIWLSAFIQYFIAVNISNIRVVLAVKHLAQHAILYSTAQHPGALQHNATTGIKHIPSLVLAALGGQLGTTLW